MTALRIGSLFTGTGALDLAVMDVYDAEVVWHSQYEPPDKNGKEDKNQYAAKILARHWPAVPNLGDITKIDWRAVLDEHGPIDILTGGFPCTDVSSAGKRAGLTPDTHSGLWNHMAHAISILQPKLVVIENVEGLLSAPATSDMEPCPDCVGDRHAGPVLRACGAVLGDLASIGHDAEWARVAASEVGAPHHRKRVFVSAWPADADPESLGHGSRGLPLRAGAAVAHAGVGSQAAANAERFGRQRQWSDAGAKPRRQTAAVVGCGPAGSREVAANADGWGREGHQECNRGPEDGQPERELGLDPVGRRVQWAAPTDADDLGRREDVLQLRPGQPDLDWGDYEPAIRRWEAILGRPAPWPTDALGRLSPVFTEWLMGLPDGWVTDTPGLTRSAMLRALGNGVVRLQAATALRLLHARATHTPGVHGQAA
jgi:DNA (cytosine-5)-methyltransferase 1